MKLRLDSMSTFRGSVQQEWTIILDGGREITATSEQEHCYCDIDCDDETVVVAGRELPVEKIIDAALVMGDCTEAGDEVDLDAAWVKRAIESGGIE